MCVRVRAWARAGNDIGDAGAASLAAAVEKSSSLTSLSLERTPRVPMALRVWSGAGGRG